MRSLSLTIVNLLLLLCLVPEASGQSRESKPTPATGSISGRVMQGEQPAPGVTVAVTPKRTMYSNSAPPLQTLTDSEGRFLLSNLAAGSYTVAPLAPGFFIPNEGLPFEEGKSITIDEGERVDDVNFVIKRGGVISGRVSNENHEAIVEIRVNLLRLSAQGQWQNFSVRNPFMSNTDDRGIYRFYGLPAGRYKVSAGENSGTIIMSRANAPYQRTYHPDAGDEAKAEIIELSDGGEALNADISINSKINSYTVTGRIIEAATGRPIGKVPYGFGVIYSGYGTAKEQAQGETQYLSASSWSGNRTNAKGEFRLEGILPGRYAVFIVKEEAMELFAEPTIFEVRESNVSGLELKARTGVSISGVAVLEGTNQAGLSSMLSQVQLSAQVSPRALEANSGNPSRISADGTFRFSGLRAGKVQLHAFNIPGSKKLTLLRIEHNGVEVKDGIEVRDGEQVSGVRMVFAHGTARIRGQVVAENGELPEGLRFFILARRGGKAEGSVETDRRGRFAFDDAIAGEYELIMNASYIVPPTTGTKWFKPISQKVTVSDGGDVQVKFVLDAEEKKDRQ